MHKNTLEGGGQLHSETGRSRKTQSTFSRFIAGVLAALLSIAGLVAIGPAAYAATPGINITTLHNDSPVSDDATVEPGDTFTLRVQYDNALEPDQPVRIGLPAGMEFDETALDVPSGNQAIESITRDGDELIINFFDSDEWGSHQGVYDFNFTIEEVEHTDSKTIEWTVDGEPSSIKLIVQKPGDEQENVSNWVDKNVGWVNLSQHVSVDDDGNVVIDENITDEKIPYTLTVNTDRETERSAFEILDELSTHLVYNDDFTATLTTWDDDGWNKETNDFEFDAAIDGSSFTSTVDLPNPSQLTVNYTASVSPEALVDLQTALQTQYDALEGEPGSYTVSLGNTAIFGEAGERDGNVNLGGNVEAPAPAPGPNLNESFNKTVDPQQVNVETDDDGNLVDPVDVTYTFDVDLTQFDGRDDHDNPDEWTLSRNVVIHDELPTQISWNTDADDFIVAEGLDLSLAADFDGDAAEFASDSYVGQYAVVGQNLYINVGQDNDTDLSIDVRAIITSVAGLGSWSNDQGWTHYYLDNNATFTYRDGEDPYRDNARTTVVDRGDTSGGVNDPSKFSKNAQSDGIEYIAPGESLTIDYQFVVDGVDVTNSYIVDERDANIFDFSDEETLADIQANITGQYANSTTMTAEHFHVSVNEDGHLVVQLSAAGIELVGDDVDNRLVVDLPLTTVEFEGKQTLNIKNHAILYGEDEEPLYWSETTSEASSFGDEAEVRKTIRDSTKQEWTQNLRVEIGEDGELVQDEYVYNLAFIPHGNYSAVTIVPVLDELPDEVEFIGFVTDDNVDTGDNPIDGPVDIGGNLEAVYDADTGTVTVQSKDGELLKKEDNISANVLIRVVDFQEDTPVINLFGNSSAEFTPSDGYPISIAKVDAEDDEVVINDPASRFRVFDADENLVIENAFVQDGQLRVHNDAGDVTGLVVREPGTYYVEETKAPEGYELSTERITVVVDEDGSSQQQTFPNVPSDEPEPEPAVEIIKGDGDAEAGTIDNDANTEEDAVAYENGETRDIVINVENTGTEDLVDVVLTDETQSGADIQDLVWTLPNGDELVAENVDGVLTASWDGPWAVGDTITGVATLTLAAGEDLHTNLASVEAVGAGSGTPVDDDDPYNATPPAPETYAIGDYVWIDANRDGIQDEDEDPLADVTVVLFDGDGSEIDRTTTNSAGRYIFDNLEAGDYQVRFILTDEQAAIYEFTDDLAGEDVEVDSDAGYNGFSSTITLGADNAYLITGDDYEHFTVEATEGIDPTWDAGVVPLPEPEEPTYAIGDYVWIDTNRDGVQDDDESPLNDVTVVLYDGDGEELDRTTTNHAGRYIFDNLPAGDYQVGFELTEEQAERYKFTDYTEGEDPAEDSDAGENGRSAVFTLGEDSPLVSNDYYEHNTVQATEGIDPTWDAGVVEILVPELEVAKNDLGDDEHQVTAGQHDVVVTLTNAGNEALENFTFEDTTESGHDVAWNEDELAGLEELVLAPGESYTVNGVVQVDAGQTHRDNVVVDATGVISGDPVDDEDPTTYHADPDPTYAIGDYVWVDSNRDGVQDEDEDPLSDVTVVLYDGEGEEIDRTTTDEKGRYIFDNLPAGDYQVGFELTEEQERQYNFTDYTEGEDPAADSNAGENGRSAVFTLGPDSPLVSNDDYEHFEVEASEGIDPTWDAGVQLKPYAIGDYVWIDSNRDGIQDDDEEPLEGVTVILYDGDTNEIERTTTDENGRYVFDYLNAGDYEVRFILTEEQAELYEFTKLREGSDSRVDSNAGYMGFSGVFTLGPDNQNLTLDYDEQEFGAPLGIDPTWDAGVVLIPEEEPGEPTPTPTDPEEPTESGTPTDPADPEEPTESGTPADPAGPSDQETPGDEEDELSRTGANFALLFGALGLILLLTGGALYARHRNGNEA